MGALRRWRPKPTWCRGSPSPPPPNPPALLHAHALLHPTTLLHPLTLLHPFTLLHLLNQVKQRVKRELLRKKAALTRHGDASRFQSDEPHTLRVAKVLLEKDQIRKRVAEQRKVLGTWRTLWATGNQTKRAPPPGPPPPPPNADGIDESAAATPDADASVSAPPGGEAQGEAAAAKPAKPPSKFAAAIKHTESTRSFWGNVG